MEPLPSGPLGERALGNELAGQGGRQRTRSHQVTFASTLWAASPRGPGCCPGNRAYPWKDGPPRAGRELAKRGLRMANRGSERNRKGPISQDSKGGSSQDSKGGSSQDSKGESPRIRGDKAPRIRRVESPALVRSLASSLAPPFARAPNAPGLPPFVIKDWSGLVSFQPGVHLRPQTPATLNGHLDSIAKGVLQGKRIRVPGGTALVREDPPVRCHPGRARLAQGTASVHQW